MCIPAYVVLECVLFTLLLSVCVCVGGGACVRVYLRARADARVLGASAREECVTLERKNADELNERISMEEVEKCVRRQRNGKAPS